MANAIVLIGNLVIVLVVLFLVWQKTITWGEGLAFIGTLAFPSAGNVFVNRMQAKKAAAVAKSIPPLMLLMLALANCKAVQPTCAVISVANDACTLIAIPLSDGGTQNVAVTPQELEQLATRKLKESADAGR